MNFIRPNVRDGKACWHLGGTVVVRLIAAVVITLAIVFGTFSSSAKAATVTTNGVVLDGWGGLHPFGGVSINMTGAPYWGGWDIAKSISVIPDGSGGWTLDGFGGIHNWGSAPIINTPAYWSGWDIARAIYVLPDKQSGYLLDGYGGIHQFGPNAPSLPGGPYWSRWDIARGLDIHLNLSGVPDGGAVLDAYGGIQRFGNYPSVPSSPGYWSGKNVYQRLHSVNAKPYAVTHFGVLSDLSGGQITTDWTGYTDWGSWDILRDTFLLPDVSGNPSTQPISAGANAAYQDLIGKDGGITLDGYGGLHPFGGAVVNMASAPYWGGWDIAKSISVIPDGSGGWTLDGFGGIHNWGSAPIINTPAYWSGWDIARAIYVLPDKQSGYLLDGYGGIHQFGPHAPPLAGSPYWGGWDIARGLDIHLNQSGVPDGGAVSDGSGGVNVFGNYYAPITSPPEYWGGKDLYQRLHSVGGEPYLVQRWGQVDNLSSGQLQPQWSGYQDYGSWDIIRDTQLLGGSSPYPAAQPISAAAAWQFQGTAWTGGVNAPAVHQGLPLNCESAALQVALNAKGTNISQYAIFNALPKDGRAAIWNGGSIARWGNAYTAFVGNVYGSESRGTGYGVYWQPIANVAQSTGHSTIPLQGNSPNLLFDQVAHGNPTVIWISDTFAAQGLRTWTAWDGQPIPYVLSEHAVTVTAVNGLAQTITLMDVGSGQFKSFGWGQFESIWSTFGNMGLVIQ